MEQVNGDMKLQSVAGDVHLKEVSGYIIVKTTSGSLVCTLCSGKLEYNSISGDAQILQPCLANVNVMTTTGNILYDGDFIHTGLYTMNSGRGLVEVRFSGNDSFDLNAQTYRGTVDNQAAAFLKPTMRIPASIIRSQNSAKPFWHRRPGFRQGRTLLLQWYNSDSEARLACAFRNRESNSNRPRSSVARLHSLSRRVHGCG